MPHLTLEYSADIRQQSDIKALCGKLARCLVAQRTDDGKIVYPIGGIRVRALPAEDYCIGDGSQDGRKRVTVPHADLSPMPASTKLLVVVGADDHRAYESLGLSFYIDTIRVPAANKNVIELESDDHGSPPLLANHAAPGASLDARPPRRALIHEFEHAGTVDALDWYGDWKLFDALSACAFHGIECATALGGGSAQTFMGTWSDGVPVKPMRVLR